MTRMPRSANPMLRMRPSKVSRLRSGTFVPVVPELRFPEFDLVLVGVHDPRKLAVLVRFGSLDDFHACCTQLLQQLAEVVDPVVDHERGPAGAEPLGVC